MDKGVTCEHLNKLADTFGKDLWQAKDTVTCFDCGCPGPNLWICLQPDCHHVGCSEVKNDHSTIHQKNFSTHCVHMNVSTERIWCYLCQKEVHIRAIVTPEVETIPVDTTTMEISSEFSPVMLTVNSDEDQDPEEMEYDDESRTKGLVGLQNMGNTCYMNAALQALSNTAPLTSYFLECAAAVAVLAGDKKPGVSRAYQKLIKEMWGRKTRGFVMPSSVLYGIRNAHPMFRGFHQHDTQEFLRCFMDQLHEELKEPVWETKPKEKITSDADGDHQDTKNVHTRRRQTPPGANDSLQLPRSRRKSQASSCSEARAEGYQKVQDSEASKHRRSASFAGTNNFTYNAITQQLNGKSGSGPVSTQLDSGSDSSEAEERYDTCSSGASDVADTKSERSQKTAGSASGGGDGGGGEIRYRSVISDVFDGRLLSSVQCLICKRVSTRMETFQDLSLPIPSREHLALIRCQQPILNHSGHATQESWVWWLLSWLRSWFYGPVVSLQDCLAAFFSADELKGDNMYSCSRCNKLRNGVKMAGVLRLPEVLCVHLKRFRHELMFSAKVAARVSFPLHDLDMAPYTHKDCTSKVKKYELCAVICHTGTAGGGHYTCIARNGRGWYNFDDQSVTPLTAHQLAHCEAYVLFYRKVNPQMALLRHKAAEILEAAQMDPNDIKFYISKQWINKFNTWAEPGPIDNSDFVCVHGCVRPERANQLPLLATVVPQTLWDYLFSQFGGGPAVTHMHECGACARAAMRMRVRRARELAAFCDLHAIFQEQDRPRTVYAISMHWFRQWQAFVRNKAQQPPPPVDNTGIVTKQEKDNSTTYTLKPGSDHAQLSEELWRFFADIYGGGPEVRVKMPVTTPASTTGDDARRLTRKYSESDREEYCSKSTSESNIRDTLHSHLHKNQSLQNINRRFAKTADSEDELPYFYKKSEPNGNYQDSDSEFMDASPRLSCGTVRMENGLDGTGHDANDNPKVDRLDDAELPNLDRISLRSKPKNGKLRKSKRRTVK